MLAQAEWPRSVQQALLLALSQRAYGSVLPSASALLAAAQRPPPTFVDAVLNVLLHPPPALSRHDAHALAALLATCMAAGTPWQPSESLAVHTALWRALKPGPGLEARVAGTAFIVTRCSKTLLARLMTEVDALATLLACVTRALMGEGSDTDTGLGRADSGAEYEVSAIVGHRLSKDKLEYKVRWRGYDARWDEWLAVADLSCQQLINAYHETTPLNAEQMAARERNLQRPPTNPLVRVLGQLLADGVSAVAELEPAEVPAMARTIAPVLTDLIPTLQLRLLRLLRPPPSLTDALLTLLFTHRFHPVTGAVDAEVTKAKVMNVILNLRAPLPVRNSLRGGGQQELSRGPTALLLVALVHALVCSLPPTPERVHMDTLLGNFNQWYKAVRDGTRALPSSEREHVKMLSVLIENLLRRLNDS